MDGVLATSLTDYEAVNAAMGHLIAPAGEAKTMDVDIATLSVTPGPPRMRRRSCRSRPTASC